MGLVCARKIELGVASQVVMQPNLEQLELAHHASVRNDARRRRPAGRLHWGGVPSSGGLHRIKISGDTKNRLVPQRGAHLIDRGLRCDDHDAPAHVFIVRRPVHAPDRVLALQKWHHLEEVAANDIDRHALVAVDAARR